MKLTAHDLRLLAAAGIEAPDPASSEPPLSAETGTPNWDREHAKHLEDQLAKVSKRYHSVCGALLCSMAMTTLLVFAVLGLWCAR